MIFYLIKYKKRKHENQSKNINKKVIKTYNIDIK